MTLTTVDILLYITCQLRLSNNSLGKGVLGYLKTPNRRGFGVVWCVIDWVGALVSRPALQENTLMDKGDLLIRCGGHWTRAERSGWRRREVAGAAELLYDPKNATSPNKTGCRLDSQTSCVCV